MVFVAKLGSAADVLLFDRSEIAAVRRHGGRFIIDGRVYRVKFCCDRFEVNEVRPRNGSSFDRVIGDFLTSPCGRDDGNGVERQLARNLMFQTSTLLGAELTEWLNQPHLRPIEARARHSIALGLHNTILNEGSIENMGLNASDCRRLPDVFDMFHRVVRLVVLGTELKTLPSSFAQMPRIRTLVLSNCCFAHLPLVIGSMDSLRTLDVSRNWLTSLPVWLARMPKLRTIDIDGNPIRHELSGEFDQLHLAIHGESGGSQRTIVMNEWIRSRVVRIYMLEAAGENVNPFRTFLTSLVKTSDYRDMDRRGTINDRLRELTAAMEKDAALRRRCYDIAEGMTCHDSAATLFDEMLDEVFGMRAARGDIALGVLLDEGRRAFRLSIVKEVAARVWDQQALVQAQRVEAGLPGWAPDLLEISMALQIVLQDDPEVPVRRGASGMLYEDAAEITSDDIFAVREEIKRRERDPDTSGDSAELERFMANWKPWRAYIDAVDDTIPGTLSAYRDEQSTAIDIMLQRVQSDQEVRQVWESAKGDFDDFVEQVYRRAYIRRRDHSPEGTQNN